MTFGVVNAWGGCRRKADVGTKMLLGGTTQVQFNQLSITALTGQTSSGQVSSSPPIRPSGLMEEKLLNKRLQAPDAEHTPDIKVLFQSICSCS